MPVALPNCCEIISYWEFESDINLNLTGFYWQNKFDSRALPFPSFWYVVPTDVASNASMSHVWNKEHE